MFSLTVATVAALALLAAASHCQEAPEMEAETDSEEISELLEYLLENPIDLNRATPEELMLIPWLSPPQALRIHGRLRGGPVSDPYRLAAEGVVDPATLEAILPYIHVEGKSRRGGKPTLASWWQRSWVAGGESEPDLCSNRQRLSLIGQEGWSACLQTQKDRGEGSWLDYWSAATGYRDGRGRFEAVAGDYQLRSGLGLAFGGTSPTFLYPGCLPRPAGKTRAAINSSANEWSALRGGAGWLKMGSWRFLASASLRRVDSRADSSGQLTDLYRDGYHRTQAELARKNNAEERLGAVSLDWENEGWLWLGGLAYACSYRPQMAESLDYRGGASVSGGIRGGAGHLSFEAAAKGGSRGAFSAVAGSRISGTEAALLVYAYQPGYMAPRFNSYERYGGSDEQGAALFHKAWLPAATTLSSVFHWFRPWSAASAVAGGHGGFLLDLKVDNGIMNNLKTALRLKVWEKERLEESDGWWLDGRERWRTVRGSVDWTAGRGFVVSADYAVSRHRPSRGGIESGEVLSAGFGWRGGKSVSIRAQSSLFRTDSYESAIYQNEPEMMGTGSFHPLFGVGRRDALLMRYTHAGRLSAELKLAYTYREYQGETVRQAEMGFHIELR
jgi:hypothetical protein